jgi:eukaryotic-like serine/threonine-protein kinase
MSRQGEVKLVEFGIARAAAKLHVTQTGEVKGTMAYMSPEQAMGQMVDARADVYSAGAILYEALTLAKPFPNGRIRRNVPDAAAIRPEIPAALQAVLERAMAHDAADRFASADAMARALAQATGNEGMLSDESLAQWVKGISTTLSPAQETKRISPDDGTEKVVTPRFGDG